VTSDVAAFPMHPRSDNARNVSYKKLGIDLKPIVPRYGARVTFARPVKAIAMHEPF
jgi:hypothetical protein